ncbi:MAG: hypothetical protein O2807_08530 [bacterium]|nr:hypothetical protein [bacterium]
MRVLVAALSLLFFSGAASADVTIQSTRKAGRMAHLRILYTNTTGVTFSSVKILCALPGASGQREQGILYLSNHLGGGLGPGYTAEGVLQVPLKEGAKPEDIACEDTGQPVRLP